MLHASKVNYPPTLLSWLSNVLKIGFLGEIQFACAEPGTQTSTGFYRELEKWGVPDAHIHDAIASAEDATTTGRNDVVLVMPATYTVTASLTWDKANTHLVGMAGPLSRGGMGAGCYMNCETTSVASVIDVQGHNCEMYGMNLRNDFAAAANKCALKVSKAENFHAEYCHFVGQCAATQVAQTDTCGLWLYTAAAGKPWGAKFKDCMIGSSNEIVRTAGGSIYVSGGTALTAKNIEFENCRIVGWSETAAAPAVYINENYAIDRYLLFKDTLFYNFYVNNASTLNQVFYDACGTTHNIIIMGSTCQWGWDSWTDAALDYVYGWMPAGAATGGKLIQVSE